MARKNTEETVESTDISDAAAATRAEIGNRPRQSVVRFVQHYVTIRDAAPEDLDRLFGSQVDALEAVADKVENPITKAIETATAAQVARSIAALENEDALNGYAAYVFDQEIFDEKTREKKPRVKRTITEKAEDLLSEASDAELEALKALLAARGL